MFVNKTLYILHLDWLSLSSITRVIQPIAFSSPFILLSVCSFFINRN